MIDSATLTELSQLGLTTEQMAAVLRLLARAVQPSAAEIELEALRSANRERQRRYYHATHNVRPNVTGEKEGEISLEVENKIPPNPPQTSDLTLPGGFDDFWEAYPSRDGARDKKAAIKAFRAAIKRDSLEAILEGAKAYRADMVARNKLNTEFVKQARTWLNNDGWKEKPAVRLVSSITGRSRHDPQPGETRQQWLNRTRST